jgi:CDP-glucose 4,6-dehydratase
MEWPWGYRENDQMGGHDPYSASKGAAELVADSYRNSFIRGQRKMLATARAGNVIGGGDMSQDRLIPDCLRALESKRPVQIRNPASTRPWQHVLEPLGGYLLLARRMTEEKSFDEAWNFGPYPESTRTVGEVAELVVRQWGAGRWVDATKKGQAHEAKTLSLDISKATGELGWRPKLTLEEAVRLTVDWQRRTKAEGPKKACQEQIRQYLKK